MRRTSARTTSAMMVGPPIENDLDQPRRSRLSAPGGTGNGHRRSASNANDPASRLLRPHPSPRPPKRPRWTRPLRKPTAREHARRARTRRSLATPWPCACQIEEAGRVVRVLGNWRWAVPGAIRGEVPRCGSAALSYFLSYFLAMNLRLETHTRSAASRFRLQASFFSFVGRTPHVGRGPDTRRRARSTRIPRCSSARSPRPRGS